VRVRGCEPKLSFGGGGFVDSAVQLFSRVIGGSSDLLSE